MARYTVYDLIIDVKGKIHGGSVPNSIQSALDEGRRNLIGKVKPPEMARTAYIEQALYPKVDKYAIADDVKYEDVIDIKMLSSYHNLDTLAQPLAQVYRREADQKNRHNVFAINWDSGVKTMTINHPHGMKNCNHIIVNECNSLTDNGNWNVGGNVVNLRLDELNHITRKASLSFDINNSSTSGFIENFSMHPVNLKDYLNTGATFAWLNIPIPTNMIAVKLTLGSNVTNLATDLYYATVNQPHDNNEFVTGWNLLKYMLNNLNSVGNPNPGALAYIRFDFTTNGQAIANCNLDAVNARKGEVYEMAYNSSFCLIDPVSRAWKQRTTRNSDIFPFEEDTYQLIMLETALVVQKNIYGNNAGAKSDVTDIEDELKDKYIEYKRQHKAEFIEPEQHTNVMGRQVYGRSNYLGHDHKGRPDNWFEQANNGGN